jgi:hypothetical protein
MPYRYRFALLSLLLVLLVLPLGLRAQSEKTAAQNKQLFDRAVDEINFRTMETVYDKTFTRRKFPVNLRTAKARKEFEDFSGRDDIKTLFRNYNGVAERFKNRFGQGRTDLVEFEKQLNSVLIDQNFEFFIRVLPRDERVALIRSLQRYIKQASAQFNASEDPSPEELPEAPLTKPLEEPEPAAEVAPEPVSVPRARAIGEYEAPRHDWVDYLTLLCSVFSLALTLYLTMSVIPGLRAQISALTPEADFNEEDEEHAPASKRRFAALPVDSYDEEND